MPHTRSALHSLPIFSIRLIELNIHNKSCVRGGTKRMASAFRCWRHS